LSRCRPSNAFLAEVFFVKAFFAFFAIDASPSGL
jgi:hypothetical protein